MVNIQNFVTNHLNYYKILEEDFVESLRYVELSEANFNTYSNEYVKQLQSICSEFEILMKYYCRTLNSESRVKNIVDWERVLFSVENQLELFTVSLEVQNLEDRLKPFVDWMYESDNNRNAPFWWKDYTSIKHNRIDMHSGLSNFNKANLKNVLYALAALCILNEVIYKKISIDTYNLYYRDKSNSKIFTLIGIESNGEVLANGFVVDNKSVST